jgi:hypothetical protein
MQHSRVSDYILEQNQTALRTYNYSATDWLTALAYKVIAHLLVGYLSISGSERAVLII